MDEPLLSFGVLDPVLFSKGHGLQALAEGERGRLCPPAAHPGHVPGLEGLADEVAGSHLK